MILSALIAAQLFLFFLDMTGAPELLAHGITQGLPRLVVVLLLGLACVLLSLLAKPVVMLVLTLPFALAIASAYGLDAVWAGILTVKMIEIALILPPLGLNAPVIAAAVRDMPLRGVLAGVVRFLFADLLVLAALALFPTVA